MVPSVLELDDAVSPESEPQGCRFGLRLSAANTGDVHIAVAIERK